MPQSFLSCDREQVLLMPSSLCEWLPENHLAWFVLSSVEAMDLASFARLVVLTVMAARRMIRR